MSHLPLLKPAVIAASLLLACAAQAQAPAAPVSPASEQPAVSTDTGGTTVVGDRESPIGLYITPWRNDAPEAELDRPARFLEEQLLPLDADVFRRQIEYFNTISTHLGNRSGSAPAKSK